MFIVFRICTLVPKTNLITRVPLLGQRNRLPSWRKSFDEDALTGLKFNWEPLWPIKHEHLCK